MVNQRELTEEGLEKNFATNTLGKDVLFIWRNQTLYVANVLGSTYR